MKGKRKGGRPRKTLKIQVEESRSSVGLKKENASIESREMESGTWRDCCQSWINLATPVYGDKPGSKLELID